MEFSKQKLSNLTVKAKKMIDSPLKKAVITTVAIATLAFHPNPVAHADSSKLTTVYDVYLNDTYLGTVSDKNIINKLASERLKKIEQTYKNMNIRFDSQIKYVPEQVTYSAVDNKNTVENLEKALQLKIEATAIVIDGKPVVYLENKSTAQEVIRKLELQYVTEEQLKDFETRSTDAKTDLPPLTDNETRILNIHLSKNVTIKSEKVAYDSILSGDQALSILEKGTGEETKYKVKDGDVLGSIAQANQLKMEDLLAMNPGLTVDSVLKADQELTIKVTKPFIGVMVEKAIKQQEAIPYQTVVNEDSTMASGDSKVSQEGQDGLQNATYQISEENGVVVNKELTKQDILKQAVNRVVIKGTKVTPSQGDGSFGWPAVGGYISSKMGYRDGKLHKGIDIARPSSPTIKAADSGVVSFAGWDNGGYGNKIVINHQNGYTTVYAHLSSIGVSVGQTVEKGSDIGVMGATGDATGVHLHFEVYKNGALQDPLNYISQ